MSATVTKPSKKKIKQRKGHAKRKPAEQSKIDWNTRFVEAVEAEGDAKTLAVIEAYCDTLTPLQDAFHRAEHHDAFQIIKRSDQVAIHNGDEDTLEEFLRRLINTLCTKHSVKRLGRDYTDNEREKTLKQLHNCID